MKIDGLPLASCTRDLLVSWDSHVQHCPNKVCITEAVTGQSYTWSQMHAMMQEQLAALRALHLTTGDRVVLLGSASAQWIACVWACWAQGVVWIAQPPPHPAARIQKIIAHAQARAVWDGNTWQGREDAAGPCDQSLAYITYTSGSTGEPKAVMVPPTAVAWVWAHQSIMFEVDSSSVCCWSLSPAFDASVSDIGVALSSGAHLVIAPAAAFSRWDRWCSMLERYQVTHIDAPPSWLNLWHKKPPPSSLKTIVCGGEPTPRSITDAWAKSLKWINVYGPTEATICTSVEQVVPCGNSSPLPTLGQPWDFVHYKIDPASAVEGELWIGGPAVALGYWRDPVLSAQRFVEDGGLRWFKTGDCVRHEDGQWYFVGRLDRQRKRNGQLLNLDEVEQVLQQHPCITQAAVIVDDQDKLVAHCCTSLSADHLRTWATGHLPAWGVPQRWVIHERLPTNVNGKIDRQGLRHAL